MKNNSVSFESESKAFAYLFAALISLCTLPVLGWHYWTNLQGFAVLAIGGLALTDCVLWFASHWSVKTETGVMRAASLAVKFIVAGVMVCVAAVVIVLMRSEHSTDRIIEQQTMARTAEISARADAAAKLAKIEGGRAAAKEMAKLNDAPAAVSIASTERAELAKILPAWLTDIGIYVIPPLVALIGALALSVCAAVQKQAEGEAGAGTGHSELRLAEPVSIDAGIRQRSKIASMTLRADPDLHVETDIKGPGIARTDKRPYAPAGYEWFAQSKGFTCRRVYQDETGKRQRRYVGFMSGKTWADLKAAHKGADLTAAIKSWINEKEQAE